MKNLNLMLPINGTGYGVVSTNVAMSLNKFDIDLAIHPIGSSAVETEEQKEILVPMFERSKTYDSKSPCLKIWHPHDLGSRIGKGKYFAFPFHELDKFTDFEIHYMNQTDELFTASEWSRNVMLNNGVSVPIHVAPLGVDTSVFFVDDEKIRIEQDNYIFIHIGKWEKRKSQDFLIEAFNNAFTTEDNVELWLFPFNPFLSQEETEVWNNLAQGSELADKIKIYGRLPTQRHLAEAMKTANCGVFLSRAEGWNMEITEMMAVNKPIIATNYSAHTEFLNSDNSYLVDVTETETAIDNKWFYGQGNWAKLAEQQMEQTVEYMRFVYNKEVKSNPVGLETAKKYTWDRTASIIRETIFN